MATGHVYDIGVVLAQYTWLFMPFLVDLGYLAALWFVIEKTAIVSSVGNLAVQIGTMTQ